MVTTIGMGKGILLAIGNSTMTGDLPLLPSFKASGDQCNGAKIPKEAHTKAAEHRNRSNGGIAAHARRWAAGEQRILAGATGLPTNEAGGERAATLCTVLESAKLNGLDPQAWLSDVIERMAKSHPINRLGELLPWNWNNQSPASPPDPCCGPQLTLTELGAKRLGLLHDIVPGARRIAALAVNVR